MKEWILDGTFSSFCLGMGIGFSISNTYFLRFIGVLLLGIAIVTIKHEIFWRITKLEISILKQQYLILTKRGGIAKHRQH